MCRRRRTPGGPAPEASTRRKEVNKELDALILQARSLWKLDPLLHPEMEVTFYVSGGRSDRDNRLSLSWTCW